MSILELEVQHEAAVDPTQVRRWQRYPKYRASGVEWHEEIPAHWNVKRLKQIVESTRRITYGIVQCGPDLDEGVPYVRPVDMGDEVGVNPNRLQKTSFEIAASYARSTVRAGDLVVSIGPSFGKVMVVPDELDGANLTQGTARVAVRRGYSSRFIFWCLRAPETRELWDAGCAGATFRALTLELLSETPVALPPTDEQHAIATFLDRETARIDALVAKKERLIELLHEKRTLLISHAVTKGLDPDVPMRDSGVEWLGEMPAHWEVKQLMYLTPDSRPIMYGIVLPGPNVQNGVPIVKGGDVAPGRLRLDRLNRTTVEIEAGFARARLRGNDIVYAIRGSIGAAELVPDELTGANLTQDAARISPRKGVLPSWLLYAVKARPFFAQLDSGAIGATIRGINIRDLKRGFVAVPPAAEQREIAEYLTGKLHRIDRLTEKVRAHIAGLHEYRTALISAAVTGKIDVRGEVTA